MTDKEFEQLIITLGELTENKLTSQEIQIINKIHATGKTAREAEKEWEKSYNRVFNVITGTLVDEMEKLRKANAELKKELKGKS